MDYRDRRPARCGPRRAADHVLGRHSAPDGRARPRRQDSDAHAVQRLSAARQLPAHAESRASCTETMMGGGVIALAGRPSAPRRCTAGTTTIAAATPSASDILRSEIAMMLRRAVRRPAGTSCCPPGSKPVAGQTKARDAAALRGGDDPHILEHLAEPLRAEDIAKVVGLHPNYALNLFTSVMNVLAAQIRRADAADPGALTAVRGRRCRSRTSRSRAAFRRSASSTSSSATPTG